MSRRSWMVGSVTFSCHSRRTCSTPARRSDDLGRVVVDRLLQRRDAAVGRFLATVIGIEETFLAGQQIAAHSGFHIHSRANDSRRVAQHLMGVFHHLIGVDDSVDAVDADAAKHHQKDQRGTDPDQYLRFRLQIRELESREFRCNFLRG